MSIRLFFVGDGPSDAAVVPAIVRNLLATSVESRCEHWSRLHGAGKGYSRKLLYAVRQAQAARCQGLVATVDADRSRGHARLKDLRAGRNKDRQAKPPFPTALGEHIPHLEAWLLDDPVAVRTALQLPDDHPVANPMKANSPKEALALLQEHSPRANDDAHDVLAEMACHVQIARSNHRRDTGFEDFAADVRRELEPAIGSNAGL